MVFRAFLRMLGFEIAIFVTYLIFQFIWINTIGYWFNATASNDYYDFFVVLGKWWASNDYISLIWFGIAFISMGSVLISFLRDPMRFSSDRP